MSVGVVEIGVVEKIENFPPELEILAFCDRNFLVHGEVPLLETRPAADATLGSDIELTQWRILKVVRVEPKAAVGLGAEFLKWSPRTNGTPVPTIASQPTSRRSSRLNNCRVSAPERNISSSKPSQ